MLELIQWGGFLGSRHLGAEIRKMIEADLAEGLTVVINCKGVDMISHSFADEFMGKLAANLGRNAFRERVKFKNVSPKIASILRYVISNRLSSEPDQKT